MRRRFLPFPLIFLGSALVAAWLCASAHLFVVNLSDSIDVGLYVRHAGEARHDDVAVFCPPERIFAYVARWRSDPQVGYGCNGGTPYIKEVVATAGDVVTFSPQGVSVNGGPVLPGSAPLHRLSTPRPHRLPSISYGKYTIGKGQIWAYGPEWYSMDSRYYGPVRPIALEHAVLIYRVPRADSPPPEIAALQH